MKLPELNHLKKAFTYYWYGETCIIDFIRNENFVNHAYAKLADWIYIFIKGSEDTETAAWIVFF